MQTRRFQKECTTSLVNDLIYAQYLKIWKDCETCLKQIMIESAERGFLPTASSVSDLLFPEDVSMHTVCFSALYFCIVCALDIVIKHSVSLIIQTLTIHFVDPCSIERFLHITNCQVYKWNKVVITIKSFFLFELQKNSKLDSKDFKQIYPLSIPWPVFVKKKEQISLVFLDPLEFKTK